MMDKVRYGLHEHFIPANHKDPMHQLSRTCSRLFDSNGRIMRNDKNFLCFLLDVQQSLKEAEQAQTSIQSDKIKRDCAKRVTIALGLSKSKKAERGANKKATNSEIVKYLDMYLFEQYGALSSDDISVGESIEQFILEIDELENKSRAWKYVANQIGVEQSTIEKGYKAIREDLMEFISN